MDGETLTVLQVNISGRPFGILATQIESLSALVQREASPTEARPGKEFSLAAGLGLPPKAASHTSLLLRAKNGIAWEVETIGQLLDLPLTALRRLPRLFAPSLPRGLWGAAVYEADLILLLDLDQLSPFPPEGE